jgi:hypothetical protein
MQPTKLQIKLFTDRAEGLSPEAFIVVFHGWIKHKLLPELMIDVANYAHVPKGPGVALIGHSNDYFIDEGDGRLGLLYSRKREAPAPGERIADAFRRTLHAASLLEADTSLTARGARLRFRTDELLFRINDRLAAPNDDATFAALKPELEGFCRELFAGPCTLSRVGDDKSLFSVKIVTPAKSDVGTLLGRLGGAPLADKSLLS